MCSGFTECVRKLADFAIFSVAFALLSALPLQIHGPGFFWFPSTCREWRGCQAGFSNVQRRSAEQRVWQELPGELCADSCGDDCRHSLEWTPVLSALWTPVRSRLGRRERGEKSERWSGHAFG